MQSLSTMRVLPGIGGSGGGGSGGGGTSPEELLGEHPTSSSSSSRTRTPVDGSVGLTSGAFEGHQIHRPSWRQAAAMALVTQAGSSGNALGGGSAGAGRVRTDAQMAGDQPGKAAFSQPSTEPPLAGVQRARPASSGPSLRNPLRLTELKAEMMHRLLHAHDQPPTAHGSGGTVRECAASEITTLSEHRRVGKEPQASSTAKLLLSKSTSQLMNARARAQKYG